MDDNFKKMMNDEMKRASCKVTLEDIKANIDIYTATSESLALLLKAYYDGFVKAGFDSMQAMYLTAQVANTMVMMSAMTGGEKD